MTEKAKKLYEDLYGSETKQEIIRLKYPDYHVRFVRDSSGAIRCLMKRKDIEKKSTKK